MPSEKRARQRALRDQKLAVVQRRDRRVRLGKRGVGGLVVVGLVIALVAVLSGHPGKTKGATKPSTTTSSTTTTLAPAVAPVCPPTTAAGAAKRETTFDAVPPSCIAHNAVFDATVKTDVGTFVIEMKAANSYAAVNNFVFLARYHFYDGVTFHRVIQDFVVQGGDPTGTGSGGPGYEFTGNAPPASCATSSDCYPLWSVAMANSSSSPKTDGSQFFVVAGSQGEALPPEYTLFGQVISGTSVVAKIDAGGSVSTDSTGTPKVRHHMISVTVSQVAA
jgi:cyclophilin family peptidyl-prolyl cis-trans isomerase